MLFEKGWIPKDLAFQSMTEIYQRTNVDLNTCVFSYNLSETDINSVLGKVEPTNRIVEMPRRIDRPTWWTTAVNKLDHNVFVNADKDSVFVAVDRKENKLYGWRK